MIGYIILGALALGGVQDSIRDGVKNGVQEALRPTQETSEERRRRYDELLHPPSKWDNFVEVLPYLVGFGVLYSMFAIFFIVAAADLLGLNLF
jgi:hypothetical protein